MEGFHLSKSPINQLLHPLTNGRNTRKFGIISPQLVFIYLNTYCAHILISFIPYLYLKRGPHRSCASTDLVITILVVYGHYAT